MIVPARLALLLALFLGAAARAEAEPSRTKREWHQQGGPVDVDFEVPSSL
ncbi:hypothetical protein [Hyalangium versicolor]|nr:hypothetical protein [Hyalangium versicolor]